MNAPPHDCMSPISNIHLCILKYNTDISFNVFVNNNTNRSWFLTELLIFNPGYNDDNAIGYRLLSLPAQLAQQQ